MKKILSFIIPSIILLFSLFLNNMLFNGTVLISDLSSQYYHFLLKFMEFLKGEGTLLYTFDFGFGGSMYGILVYYLLSISNIFLKFISYENLYYYILLIIILKIGLCGLTMYKYLEYNFNSKKYILIFSTSYALSSFILTNYFQIMWLDSYVLAPLILLGIDKIIKENKFILYCITLTLTIFTNYYTGFIICFFCVFYFIYKSLINKTKLKNISTFLIISFLSGMMTMATNFNAFMEIIEFGRINKFETGFNTDFSKIISGLFIGNEMEPVINFTYPRLYISILMVLLLFLYFINKKIDKREKIISSLSILVFVLFMLFKPLNNIWHAFSSPIGFNFRYVFLINIFVIYLGYKSFEKIEHVSKIYYLLFIYIFLIFSIIIYITKTNTILFIILSLIISIIYSLLFYFSKTKYIILIFIIEIVLNTYFVYNDYDTLKSTDDMIDPNILEVVEKIKNNEESLFYRMDLINLGIRTNDNILYNYYSASSWLSTIKYSNLSFLKDISYDVGINTYHFKSNDISNSLFGIKYYADKKSYDEALFSYKDYNIYKNENALSLGYIVNDNVKKDLICLSSFDCQEKMLNYMTGNNSDIYKEIIVEKKNGLEYEANFDKNDDIYIYIELKYVDNLDLDIYINDKFVRKVDSYNYDIDNVIKMSGFLEEEYKTNENIQIKLIDNNNSSYDQVIKLYSYNYENYEKEIQKLKTNQLYIDYFSDEYIKGKIDGGGVMFTSIPYDENWSIYIDGEEVETYEIFDMFLGADINSGNHTIEFKYNNKTFKYGLSISITSFILLILYNIYRKRKNKIL